jgi:hypothetical protein
VAWQSASLQAIHASVVVATRKSFANNHGSHPAPPPLFFFHPSFIHQPVLNPPFHHSSTGNQYSPFKSFIHQPTSSSHLFILPFNTTNQLTFFSSFIHPPTSLTSYQP